MKKKFVRVLTDIDENGIKTPKVIDFDGVKYEIDRVLDMKKCPSMKVGGVGERYRVRIKGKETNIFFEDNKWFVEEK
ncbi:MAG: hypothetical protein E7345_04895 [Clostridiales bacterium]|nr:hypothetical protein [Clostridiales bacterium]